MSSPGFLNPRRAWLEAVRRELAMSHPPGRRPQQVVVTLPYPYYLPADAAGACALTPRQKKPLLRHLAGTREIRAISALAEKFGYRHEGLTIGYQERLHGLTPFAVPGLKLELKLTFSLVKT